ncbi:MAG: hypothetical protein SFU56_07450 [Capsulimonadales bacterium]|nr:hypothetical protein [Capsulimonadales bacterium]
MPMTAEDADSPVDGRKNPNKAEDNDLTGFDANGPGNGDRTNGTPGSEIAGEGLIETTTTRTPAEPEEETGGMNSGTSSGIRPPRKENSDAG